VTADLLARRDPDQWLASAIERLDEWGLVLDSDPKLPSLPSLVVERTVRGSWWADPEVHLIHRLGSRFTQHEDVLHVVLVSGKLTCVHRRLWPAFLAVALGNEQWKVDGLSTAGKGMLARLRREQRLTADEPDLPSTSVKANGAAMRELESRLLCAGGDVHTSRGSHAKYVTTWAAWQAQQALPTPNFSAEEGRRQLDECLDRLNRESGGRGRLPWWRSRRS
jgi:hypothetical protein